MTDQHRGWNPALALRAAKTRKVVIGMDFVERPSPLQRNAPPLPESKFEVCKAGYCESFEHRSPPLPLCAAGQ
jgi:hypothetical protein